MNGRTVVVLALAAALIGPASALSTLTTERVGSLEATGTGTVAARGGLTAFGQIEGSVLVRDRQGRAVVKVNGVRQRPRVVGVGSRTVRVYNIRRANGAFYIQGRDVRIELRSPDTQLSVTMFGRGTVTQLTGEGTFRLNAGEEQQWSGAVVPFSLRPPPPKAQKSVQQLIDRTGIPL